MKKEFIITSIMTMLIGLSTGYSQISLYKSADFTGDKVDITSNWQPASDEDPWNDAVNSIKVPKGQKIIIFEHVGVQGKSLELTKDWVADASWKNRISSIKVVPVVTLYQSADFTGPKKEVTSDWSATSDMSWNDKIHSIKVPAGWKIIIYEDGPTKGKSLELIKDWVADASWKNRVSNIKVIPVGM